MTLKQWLITSPSCWACPSELSSWGLMEFPGLDSWEPFSLWQQQQAASSGPSWKQHTIAVDRILENIGKGSCNILYSKHLQEKIWCFILISFALNGICPLELLLFHGKLAAPGPRLVAGYVWIPNFVNTRRVIGGPHAISTCRNLEFICFIFLSRLQNKIVRVKQIWIIWMYGWSNGCNFDFKTRIRFSSDRDLLASHSAFNPAISSWREKRVAFWVSREVAALDWATVGVGVQTP